MMKEFVLSDESLNSQGFWVKTEGISLERFEKNPVMLWNHSRSWSDSKDTILPIGHWENIRVEEGKLLAKPVFDMNDEFAAKIAKKVEQGHIKSCSIGFSLIEESEDAELLKPGQTRRTIKKCQLLECSIVDIPANENAVALYDTTGNRVELSADGECPVGLISFINTNNFMNEKIVLSLGLPDKSAENEVIAEIERLRGIEKNMKTLQAEKEKAENELKELKEKIDAATKHEATAMIEQALKEGKIDASNKATFEKLFAADHESAKQLLSTMKKSVTLADLMHKDGADLGNVEALSWDELDKSDKLQALKENNPETYKAKFVEKFGHAPINM